MTRDACVLLMKKQRDSHHAELAAVARAAAGGRAGQRHSDMGETRRHADKHITQEGVPPKAYETVSTVLGN